MCSVLMTMFSDCIVQSLKTVHAQTVRHKQQNTTFYISKFLQFEAVFNFHVYDYVRMTIWATFFHLKYHFYREDLRPKKLHITYYTNTPCYINS